mgnify:CR=1 FL=1
MLQFSSGFSTGVNSKLAAQECVELALGEDGGDDCSLLVLHSTVGHNFGQAIAAARAACPNAKVIGCTGSGVIGRDGVSENMRSMALMAVKGDEFAVASSDGLNSGNSEELATKVAQEIKDARPDVSLIYILTSGLDLCGDDVVAGI